MTLAFFSLEVSLKLLGIQLFSSCQPSASPWCSTPSPPLPSPTQRLSSSFPLFPPALPPRLLLAMILSINVTLTTVIVIGGKNKITDKCQWMTLYHQNFFFINKLPTVNRLSVFKLSPDTHGRCWVPTESAAWPNLATSISPTSTHFILGSGWNSSTWQAKEKPTWSLAVIVQVHLFPDWDNYHIHFTIITSDLMEFPSSTPPFTLSLPPTIEAWAKYKGRGREARGFQAVAPGRRVSTDEKKMESSFRPPATTSACSEKVGWAGLTPVAGRAEQKWLNLFSGSWGSSSTKPLMLYLQFFTERGQGQGIAKVQRPKHMTVLLNTMSRSVFW